MSADRQRLVGAIRRMVKTDPDIRDLLGGSKNKGDQAGSGAKAASQGEEERICCDGSTAPPNLGTEERDPDSGGQDASDGLDPDDPANLDMGAGSLTGLTDCSSGEPICFDGDGFIPPDGWDDPGTPPIHPDYQEGFAWESDPSVGGLGYPCYGDLPQDVATCLAARLNDDPDFSGATVDSVTQTSESEYAISISYIESGTFGRTFESTAKRLPCGDVLAVSGFTCTTEPPLQESWPSDGCVNLAVKGGAIVGSKYDPENGGAYSKPLSEINLCDGNGNQITLAPSADGGWKTIDAINGGDGYLYDSQGQQIARISGDEFSDPTI